MSATQLHIDWTQVVHKRENNSESEQHLHENKYKFIGQCAYVKSLLENGVRLTVVLAVEVYKITSLPRRIKDLKSKGVPIETKWILDSDGKRSHVEYFITKK